METALATIDQGRPATLAEVRTQVNLIQQVMRSIMVSGTHYGIIPGCKTPSLYKPGSEVILSTFRIAVTPEVEDLSTPDRAHFRVKVLGHTANGHHVGTGIGECSSSEDKYMWRKAVCNEEFDATPEDRRRIKWGKAFKGDAYSVKQVRTNPADFSNTVLKMAKKRAQIDMCLTATAASDVFTQDIEDLPEGTELEHGDTRTIQQPQAKKPAPSPVETAKAIDAAVKTSTGAAPAPAPREPGDESEEDLSKGVPDELEAPGGSYAVLEISKKNGVTKGKAWTLYGIKTEAGYLNTFDSKFVEIAEEAKQTGQHVIVTWKDGFKGSKDLVSIKLA